MRRKRNKRANLKRDFIPLGTRFFSMKKGSKFLFVSSSNSKLNSTEIVRCVRDLATKNDCQTIIHAGWSFKNAGRKSKSLIADTISDTYWGSKTRTYIAEIGTNYYIWHSENGHATITRCARQRFYNSSEEQAPVIEKFLREMKAIKSTKVAENSEYPCFLLIYGENNIFNSANRRGGKFIERPSKSDTFLSHLVRIQNKQWIILNPSHAPYSPRTEGRILAFHEASSNDRRIRYGITGNNCRVVKPKLPLNRALLWSNGKYRELKPLNVIGDRSIRTHFGQIR